MRDFKSRRSGLPNLSVRIEEKRPLRVAFLRHLGPYQEVGAAWDRLLPPLGRQGLIGGDSLFIGICHDDPEVTPPERLRYDACLTVDDRFRPEKFRLGGEVGVQTIPGGEYAVATHFGPYRRMGETYAKLLGQWLPRSGRELRSSPCLEVYLNSPEATEPENLLTDVQVPLQPRRRGPSNGGS